MRTRGPSLGGLSNMPVNSIYGDDNSNTLYGSAGPDLIYGYDPNGPESNVTSINATRVATGLSSCIYATYARSASSTSIRARFLQSLFSMFR